MTDLQPSSIAYLDAINIVEQIGLGNVEAAADIAGLYNHPDRAVDIICSLARLASPLIGLLNTPDDLIHALDAGETQLGDLTLAQLRRIYLSDEANEDLSHRSRPSNAMVPSHGKRPTRAQGCGQRGGQLPGSVRSMRLLPPWGTLKNVTPSTAGTVPLLTAFCSSPGCSR